MSLFAWILALIITVGAASVQGTVGLGFAMVSVPLLSLIHPSLAPVPQLLVAFPLTITMAWRERHAIDLHGFWWIIGGRIPGAFLGVALLAVASQRSLDITIALIVLGAVTVIAKGIHIRRTPATKLTAGIASGATGVIASIGGPAVALVYSADDSDTIRSTLAAVFTFGIATSAVFRYASGNISWIDARVAAVLFPAVILGYVLSLFLKERVSRESVRMAILIVSTAAAVALLIRPLVT
ncbi:MAG: sulfite exporter TauE/SafE family protein [Acidimicrobiia bacterium]|nr:MAG: sulfite exporter TauE/SafE family protein [Acidimicrobiia bacterium]